MSATVILDRFMLNRSDLNFFSGSLPAPAFTEYPITSLEWVKSMTPLFWAYLCISWRKISENIKNGRIGMDKGKLVVDKFT